MAPPLEPPAPAPAARRTLALRQALASAFEWTWRPRALREARAHLAASSAKARLVGRGRHALEAAARLLDPSEPLARGDSSPLALSLYREAAYWALAALARGADGGAPGAAAGEREPRAALGELWAGADAATLERAAGGPEGLAALRACLVGQTFADAAEAPPQDVQADARRAADFVGALLDRADEPRARVERAWLQRALRTLVVLALLALAIDGAARLRLLIVRGRDLAAGRAWRPSSVLAPCEPAKHACVGVTTDILFHTTEEDSPWLEIDLGAPTAFHRVYVTNRSDCCAERAVPLVIEASDDREAWRPLAGRAEPFQTWKASFERQTARYVRLRVERRSILHLDGVSIYR